MGIFIILMCFLCCGYGLVLIFAKDSAWSYVAWRNRNAGLASERTDQWNASATFQGIALIVVGIGLLFFLPHSASRNAVSIPQPGQTTIMIDGRKPTPQEQADLQHEFEDGAFKDGKGQSPSTGH